MPCLANAHSRRSRSSSIARAVPKLLSVCLLLLLFSSTTALANLSLTTWINCPEVFYEIAGVGLEVALEQDLQAAATAAAGSAASPTVTITSIAPPTNTEPAIGLIASYTVANSGTLTGEQVNAAVLASPLPTLNAAVQAVFSGLSVRALPAAGPSAVTPVATNITVGVSGPSFLWYLVFEFAQLSAQALDLARVPLAFDLQSILDKTATGYLVSLLDTKVNATGFFGSYSVYAMPSVARARALLTREQVESAMLYQRLPLYTAKVDELFSVEASISEYRPLMPSILETTVHLLPDPDDDDDSLTTQDILRNVSHRVRLYFSGTPAGWADVVGQERAAFSDALVAILSSSFKRYGFVNHFMVSDAYTTDQRKAKVEGLYVLLDTVQGETQFSRHTYSVSEIASVLGSDVNYTDVLAYYKGEVQPANASATRVAVPSLVAVSIDDSFSMVCAKGCRAGIAVGAVGGALTVVVVLIAVIVVCCCYRGSSVEDRKDSEPDGAEEANEAEVFVTNGDGSTSRYVRYNNISDPSAGQLLGYPAKPEAAAINPLYGQRSAQGYRESPQVPVKSIDMDTSAGGIAVEGRQHLGDSSSAVEPINYKDTPMENDDHEEEEVMMTERLSQPPPLYQPDATAAHRPIAVNNWV